jgi:predicted ATPase
LIAVEGYAAPAVERAYSRARELCDRVGEGSQIFPIQFSLSIFYMVGAQHQKGLDVSGWLLDFARKEQDPALQLVARIAASVSSFWMGRPSLAHDHLQQAADLYDQERDRSLAVLYGSDMGVICFSYLSWTLWHMGFPDQAVKVANRALTLAEALPDSNSMGMGLSHTALLYLHLRNAHLTQHWAEAAIALASERGFAQWLPKARSSGVGP